MINARGLLASLTLQREAVTGSIEEEKRKSSHSVSVEETIFVRLVFSELHHQTDRRATGAGSRGEYNR
ncbi:hypothetical protein NQZ68_022666 [Dissostichus eleginoides]|nr:hypothetical protein NQZ68_022666 [Dissostichus eleginoides]